MTKQEAIKHVAIYLRKSRDEGEGEDVLAKHRNTLVNLAMSRGWKADPIHDTYEEVVSGEKLEHRHKMQLLLKQIDKGIYDGVLVMDIDRLGRGDMVEWAIIKQVFKNTETLIVTPNKIYDLETDSDDLMFNIESIIAQMELKNIKRRLQLGKRAEAEKGKWVNGFPPFPYFYDNVTRTLRVDDLKRPYYRKMVEMYIEGKNLIDIARWLTKHLPTKYNITNKEDKRKGWSTIVVKRILESEIHLGLIVYGKIKKRKINELLPETEWHRVKGEHEALKTEEEHKAILARIAKCKKLNPKARATVLPLSGLLYCEKCGGRMGIRVVHQPDGSIRWRLKCGSRNADNNMCRQKGKHFDGSFLQKIYETVIKVDKNILMELVNSNKQTSSVKPILEGKKKELAKCKQALERLFELWEEGNIAKSMFLERKASREAGIKKLQEEIKELVVLAEVEEARPTLQDMKRRIQWFKEEWWKVISPKDQNMLLATIIDKIYYNREGRTIYLNVQYK